MVFSQFRSLSIRKSAFVNVLKFSSDIISRLVCQSKFQLFIYTTLRPPCWRTKEVFQHGGSILGSVILRRTFRRISQLWGNAHTLNLEDYLLYLSFIISQFLYFVYCKVFYFISYCVTMAWHSICKLWDLIIELIFLGINLGRLKKAWHDITWILERDKICIA